MMTRGTRFILAAAMSALLSMMASAQLVASTAEPLEKEWRFRVYLDDKEIGSHNFFLTEGEDVQQLRSEAQFVYKLLFVKLYEYLHFNTETWQNDCLAGIESETDANGKPYRVRGEREGAGFRVSGSKGETLLPDCVMTFAYWNPDFLQQQRLLNSQNGEYVEIEVQPPTADQLEVRGSVQPARRYQLTAGELEINLWYSLDREWLALESVTDGRSLRYELL
jgi:hypothetical protein